LTPKRLDDQYRAWQDQGLPPSTVRLCHAHLSAALNQAVKWGWLDRNPTQRGSAPAQARSQARSITPDNLQRLIATAEPDDPRLAVAIALAALTGCRRSELCALRWSDVDLATGKMHVSRAYTPVNGQHIETNTKTHQSRSIALDAVAIEVLNRRWDFQGWYAEAAEVPLVADPYILSSEPTGGEPLAPPGLSHAFARLNRRVGLDYHLHELVTSRPRRPLLPVPTSGPWPGGWGTPIHPSPCGSNAHAVEARDREVAAIVGRRCGLN
jgi:integrase